MRAGTNPEVCRLVEREKENIERSASTGDPFESARECITALLAVLSLRQRYFALVGEHFSVFDFHGITAMDQLDDSVLHAAHLVLQRRPQAAADENAEKDLADAFANVPALPQHPVAYMVLFQLRRIFEAFDAFVSEGGFEDEDKPIDAHEAAFLKRIALGVESYVNSRKTPITRHFGDMAREYSVVSRLHCPCGQSKYEVKMQSLVNEPTGQHFDRLKVKCGACGQDAELEFPLPFFGDLSIA